MSKTIKLHASLTNYSQFVSRKSNPTFRRLAKKIFERDQYTCQYCGFQAREYQEIVNVDQNYQLNKPANLATACCFCTQCFFLESVGEGGYGGGVLIYLPEMTQMEINSLCHVLFCAMINETNYKESAQSIYRSLRMRSQIIEDKLGDGTSNPAAFAQMYIDYQTNHQQDASSMLENLRLLPSRSRFKKQIERWALSAASEVDEEEELET